MSFVVEKNHFINLHLLNNPHKLKKMATKIDKDVKDTMWDTCNLATVATLAVCLGLLIWMMTGPKSIMN
jgi:hypothetical protein